MKIISLIFLITNILSTLAVADDVLLAGVFQNEDANPGCVLNVLILKGDKLSVSNADNGPDLSCDLQASTTVYSRIDKTNKFAAKGGDTIEVLDNKRFLFGNENPELYTFLYSKPVAVTLFKAESTQSWTFLADGSCFVDSQDISCKDITQVQVDKSEACQIAANRAFASALADCKKKWANMKCEFESVKTEYFFMKPIDSSWYNTGCAANISVRAK